MIDLHSHFLPGIDDGAKDWGATMAMLEEAERDGVSCAVATPHYHTGVFAPPGPEVKAILEEAREKARDAGLAIRLEAAHEIRGMAGVIPRIRSGEILAYPGGMYLLLELPSNEIPLYIENLLFEIEVGEMTPLLAHPERNRALAKSPERLEELVERGVRTQITGASLLGMYGPSAEEAARVFLARGLVHVVASDGHLPQLRPMILSDARVAVGDLIGEERSKILFDTNPRRVIEGKELLDVHPEIVEDARPSGWWRRIIR